MRKALTRADFERMTPEERREVMIDSAREVALELAKTGNAFQELAAVVKDLGAEMKKGRTPKDAAQV